jgi:hypothetical protein
LNPCGISYNPHSILKSVKYASGSLKVDLNDIAEHQGVFYHPDFHSHFSASTKAKVYENIQEHLEEARNFVSSDVVILSLGSAFAYHEVPSGNIVNNCHKLPASSFEKKLLPVELVIQDLQDLVEILKAVNPNVSIIGTVSPVRHLRDGMVNNNRSKSTLNLALHAVDDILYFPSYELLLDDLRDYRFYDRDLIHPSPEAVEYILEFFEGQYFSEKESNLRKKILQVQKDLEHRAFLPASSQHQKFLKGLIQKIETIMEDANVDLKEELALTKSRLL